MKCRPQNAACTPDLRLRGGRARARRRTDPRIPGLETTRTLGTSGVQPGFHLVFSPPAHPHSYRNGPRKEPLAHQPVQVRAADTDTLEHFSLMQKPNPSKQQRYRRHSRKSRPTRGRRPRMMG